MDRASLPDLDSLDRQALLALCLAEIEKLHAQIADRDELGRETRTRGPGTHCCPDCGSELRQFGQDVSEQLEYIAEGFTVIRQVRPKFPCTGRDRVVAAPGRSGPAERGLAGPGALGR